MAAQLPPDAPHEAIRAYVELSQQNRGANKGNNVNKEQLKAAEQAILNYMHGRGIGYIPVHDRYLVVKKTTKVEGWSDELVLKAFIMFHNNNFNQGNSIEEVAMKFLNYCKQIRKGAGEEQVTLTVSKRRPLAATIEELHRMGGGLM